MSLMSRMSPRPRSFDRFLTDRDRAVFKNTGHGARIGFGHRPVVLVIDTTYNFCGERLTLPAGLETWPASAGEDAWRAVEHMQTVLAVARAVGVPVVYTTELDYREDGADAGRWARKNPRKVGIARRHPRGNPIVDELAPRPGDLVIAKGKPSAFFGTLLASQLVALGADSLVVCGGSTSGCVRATVVDAFSHNYPTTVVEECTFDRGQASRALALFDMDAKYADVITVAEAIAHLRGLARDVRAAAS
jgi:maleamate amidohydrolase